MIENYCKRVVDLRRIDSRIRGVVIGLNEAGFETTSSCAGHKKRKGTEEGYIIIIGNYPNGSTIKQLGQLGLKDIRVEHEDVYNTGLCTVVRFPGLGGSRGYVRNLQGSRLSLTEEKRIALFLLFSRNLSRLGVHHFSKKAVAAGYAFSRALEGEEIQKKEVGVLSV